MPEDYSALSRGELITIIFKQAREIETLKETIIELQEKIKQNLLSSKVVYADEAGGRENGVNGYNWSFSNEQFQLLIYRKSRSAKVVKEVFGENGENFEGVCVSDFYSSYNLYLGPHQRCWIHYLRDIKKLLKDQKPDPSWAHYLVPGGYKTLTPLNR